MHRNIKKIICKIYGKIKITYILNSMGLTLLCKLVVLRLIILKTWGNEIRLIKKIINNILKRKIYFTLIIFGLIIFKREKVRK